MWQMTKPSDKIARPKPEFSTRVGANGTVLAGVDMRTHGGRRFKELTADLVHHLQTEPTPPQMAIIRRAAALSVWCEGQEALQASGGEMEITTYSMATNTLRRLMHDLGLHPHSRDVTPTLRDYIDARAEGDG